MTFRGATQPRKNRLCRGRSSGASRGRSSGPLGVAHRGLAASLIGPSRGCSSGALGVAHRGPLGDAWRVRCRGVSSMYPNAQNRIPSVESIQTSRRQCHERLEHDNRPSDIAGRGSAVPRSSPALGSLSIGKRTRLEPRRPMPKALQLVAGRLSVATPPVNAPQTDSSRMGWQPHGAFRYMGDMSSPSYFTHLLKRICHPCPENIPTSPCLNTPN